MTVWSGLTQIKTIGLITLALAVTLSVVLVLRWGGTATAGHPLVLDHFQCYFAFGPDIDVGGPTQPPLLLEDQFGITDDINIEVDGVEAFCNPVQKTHHGDVTFIQDAKLGYHATGYKKTIKNC